MVRRPTKRHATPFGCLVQMFVLFVCVAGFLYLIFQLLGTNTYWGQNLQYHLRFGFDMAIDRYGQPLLIAYAISVIALPVIGLLFFFSGKFRMQLWQIVTISVQLVSWYHFLATGLSQTVSRNVAIVIAIIVAVVLTAFSLMLIMAVITTIGRALNPRPRLHPRKRSDLAKLVLVILVICGIFLGGIAAYGGFRIRVNNTYIDITGKGGRPCISLDESCLVKTPAK